MFLSVKKLYKFSSTLPLYFRSRITAYQNMGDKKLQEPSKRQLRSNTLRWRAKNFRNGDLKSFSVRVDQEFF